jgi:hypothetical protein
VTECQAEQEHRRNPVVSPLGVGLTLIVLYREMKALKQLLGPMPFSIAG